MFRTEFLFLYILVLFKDLKFGNVLIQVDFKTDAVVILLIALTSRPSEQI